MNRAHPAVASAKPLLRGVSHQVAFFVALVATSNLVAWSRSGAPARAALVFGASMILLFGTSALYHRRNWSERAGDEIRSWFGDDQAQRRRRVDEMEDHSRPPSRADLRDAPFDRERWERERWQTRDRWELRDRNDRDTRDRMDPDISDHPPRPHDRGDGRHDRDRSDLAGRGRTEERVHEVMTRNVATVHPPSTMMRAKNTAIPTSKMKYIGAS